MMFVCCGVDRKCFAGSLFVFLVCLWVGISKIDDLLPLRAFACSRFSKTTLTDIRLLGPKFKGKQNCCDVHTERRSTVEKARMNFPARANPASGILRSKCHANATHSSRLNSFTTTNPTWTSYTFVAPLAGYHHRRLLSLCNHENPSCDGFFLVRGTTSLATLQTATAKKTEGCSTQRFLFLKVSKVSCYPFLGDTSLLSLFLSSPRTTKFNAKWWWLCFPLRSSVLLCNLSFHNKTEKKWSHTGKTCRTPSSTKNRGHKRNCWTNKEVITPSFQAATATTKALRPQSMGPSKISLW